MLPRRHDRRLERQLRGTKALVERAMCLHGNETHLFCTERANIANLLMETLQESYISKTEHHIERTFTLESNLLLCLETR